ncbi:hypothetical protein ACOMHN_065610 [Nucella lapillus]
MSGCHQRLRFFCPVGSPITLPGVTHHAAWGQPSRCLGSPITLPGVTHHAAWGNPSRCLGSPITLPGVTHHAAWGHPSRCLLWMASKLFVSFTVSGAHADEANSRMGLTMLCRSAPSLCQGPMLMRQIQGWV